MGTGVLEGKTGVEAPQTRSSGFIRSVGLRQAVAINMTQMVGIGPFVTIPLMVAAFGGAQAILGWIAGAVLAMCDGLIWAELGAAMPGAGGTYIYLREAFQYWTGKLMPFLFVWTAIVSIPLIMSTGVIGVAQYLGYLYAPLSDAHGWQTRALSVALTAAIVFALYRRIDSIAKITQVLWVVMLLSVLLVIAASFTKFNPSQAFDFSTFSLNGKFFVGLGAGLLIGVYDYLGYNTTAYMAEEIREPGRILPKSIVLSILAIMTVYLVMNIGVLGVLPADQVAKSSSVASAVLEASWGKTAAQVVTVLIVVTGIASVFCGLLGGSRVPYHAALDGVFLRRFGQLHPRLRFPHLALLLMGVVCAAGTFFDLGQVIAVALAVFVIVQGLGQAVALTVLRRRQPGLVRPYKMWLYPLPSVIAFVLWCYVYVGSGPLQSPANWIPVVGSLAWLAVGVVAFLIWARVEKIWPFGPKAVREVYLEKAQATGKAE